MTDQGPDLSNVRDRRLFSRAVEATIWGMPAVSMAAFRRSLPRDLDAAAGDVVFMSDVMEPRHAFLTANNQTPYVVLVFDLRDGPWVLDVPAATDKVALFGSGIDSWEVPLVDVGPTGDDEGRGARYVCIPPGWDAPTPAGWIAVASPTYFVHFALRPITIGEGTLADAVSYSKQLRAYRLADAADPPPSRYIDAFPREWDTLPRFDLDFLRLLAEVVEIEPAQTKDAAMLGLLADIGIQKGVPFTPDSELAELFTAAVREAQSYLRDFMVSRAFVPFWPDSSWNPISLSDVFGMSYYGDDRLDYDRRGVGFYFGTWVPKRLGEPGKLPASWYLLALRDDTGALFDGNALYRVQVPADTPVRDFWSIIAYDIDTNAFIPNPQQRVGVSSFDKDRLTINDDGSIDVYIGPSPLSGLDANWIPTNGKDFWLVARFYGPEPRLFDHSWVFPNPTKIE